MFGRNSCWPCSRPARAIVNESLASTRGIGVKRLHDDSSTALLDSIVLATTTPRETFVEEFAFAEVLVKFDKVCTFFVQLEESEDLQAELRDKVKQLNEQRRVSKNLDIYEGENAVSLFRTSCDDLQIPQTAGYNHWICVTEWLGLW